MRIIIIITFIIMVMIAITINDNNIDHHDDDDDDGGDNDNTNDFKNRSLTTICPFCKEMNCLQRNPATNQRLHTDIITTNG